MMNWIFERFNALFGWLLSLGMGGRLDWVAQDWLSLVLLIVILGVIADIAVYFLRYRPDRAWRRFFSRRPARARSKAPDAPRAAVMPQSQAPEPPTVAAPRPPLAEQATGVFHMPPRPARPARSLSPAERFQPAPPKEGYDTEPVTMEPRTGAPVK